MEVQVETNVKSDHKEPHVEKETEKTDPLPPELDNSVLVSPGDTTLVETDDPHSGDKINECKESNTDELVHDLNVLSNSKQDEHTDVDRNIIMDNEASRTEATEQPVDDTVSPSELLGDDVVLTMNDKSNIQPETSGKIHVNSVDNKPDFNLDQDNVSGTGWQRDSGGCDGGEDIGTATSARMVDPPVPDTIVEKANICEEKGFDANMDMDINNKTNELISETEKVDAESSSGIFLDRFGLDKDGATVVEGIGSVKAANTETLTSFQEQESDGTYNNNNAGLTSSRLDELFDVGTDAFGSYEENELNNNLELDMMHIDSNKSEEVKLDDFSIFRNNEPKRTEANVLDFNTKTNLEFCSLVPSENEQEFGFQDCLYDDTMEERKEESSERGLLNHFSDDIFENKMYSTPLDGLKFDEDRDLNSNELSLAFGNSNVDVHTNLSMVNSSMVEGLKSGSGSVGGLFNLSGNVKTSSFQSSWEGIKSDEFKFKSSGSKFNTAFGSNPGRSHEEVVPNGMWRTGDGSQLQSGLTIPSHPHIPSPSSYHSFNIMPGKAGGGQFRLDERYSEGYGVTGLRSSRPEPVEFSFLTGGSSQHNPHQLQGDSRVFPYNSGMDQQFNNFWLGKNTMMPNPTGRNQMTAVCALCRNDFHLHPHFQAQNGIAPLCPSCSAGMSGHANLL
ncbi:uncharacterized protein LOC143618135 [Bidens hawaiensis]|uniref:uncharacterized protein LOC143618135 n=1 Tax=Bidens hawaiensis TaxID=980011 RepID=UPI00404B856F